MVAATAGAKGRGGATGRGRSGEARKSEGRRAAVVARGVAMLVVRLLWLWEKLLWLWWKKWMCCVVWVCSVVWLRLCVGGRGGKRRNRDRVRHQHPRNLCLVENPVQGLHQGRKRERRKGHGGRARRRRRWGICGVCSVLWELLSVLRVLVLVLDGYVLCSVVLMRYGKMLVLLVRGLCKILWGERCCEWCCDSCC